MKMIMAIMEDHFSDATSSALVKANYRVTRLASTGGLLREGATTLMVGVAAHSWRAAMSAGATTGEAINADWWRALELYAGISAPPGAGFGALALSEIARNQDLLTDVFGTVIAYQFLAAACADATVPLHQCSMAGDGEFGARLYEMLGLES